MSRAKSPGALVSPSSTLAMASAHRGVK
jgi:hypothetical protein